MCTKAMQIAKTYGCRIEGVDLNAKALEKVLKMYHLQTYLI